MHINFSEEEAILLFNGVEIRIQEEVATDIAKQILGYFEEENYETDKRGKS